MPAEDLHGRTVGVDRLQPGDHAFLGYTDDETLWEILSVFTQQGFAREEKVGLSSEASAVSQSCSRRL